MTQFNPDKPITLSVEEALDLVDFLQELSSNYGVQNASIPKGEVDKFVEDIKRQIAYNNFDDASEHFLEEYKPQLIALGFVVKSINIDFESKVVRLRTVRPENYKHNMLSNDFIHVYDSVDIMYTHANIHNPDVDPVYCSRPDVLDYMNLN